MAYTIDLDDGVIGVEELQLVKTKQAILEKLRVRFGEMGYCDGWAAALPSDAKKLSNSCGNPPR